MSNSLETAYEQFRYTSHKTPTLSSVPNDTIPVYKVPNESGYFPTGNKDKVLVSFGAVQLYQIHPKYARRTHEVDFPLLAEGAFSLSDPAPGTPSEVAIVADCDGITFFVLKDDATIKVSKRVFTILLPEDCIRIQFPDDTADDALNLFEALLAARTKFKERFIPGENSELVPKGRMAQPMYNFSVWLANGIVTVSEKGSDRIESYSKEKQAKITETKDVNISEITVKAALTAKKAAKTTNKVVGKISDKVSKTIGGAFATTLQVREGDSKGKRRGKRYVVASALAFSEVAGALEEGYDKLIGTTKDEATAFVAAKYGFEASQLVRHTVGTAVHFGKAALIARRVLNVKEVLKESGKVAVSKTIKNSSS